MSVSADTWSGVHDEHHTRRDRGEATVKIGTILDQIDLESLPNALGVRDAYHHGFEAGNRVRLHNLSDVTSGQAT